MIARICPTIMDGIVVRWTPDEHGMREISASRNGVAIKGWLVTEHDYSTFLSVVAAAWNCYRLLAQDAERFRRLRTEDVKAWLVEKGQRVVDVHFGETLAEALKREASESAISKMREELK
jgi:hypothetical protein